VCGLIFAYSDRPSKAESNYKAANALARISHRGPDAKAIKQKSFATIGHCRLSIIDLASSAQPMEDSSNRYTLSYNGEIYNYRDVRKELEGKWQFKTQGDTEVLLAGLIIIGSRFLQKLEGMWAFALWDDQDKTLMLARDRLGKKPLYFQDNRENFYCASELPALSCLIDSPLEEDLDSSADYFRHGFHLPGHTAYKNIHEVLPGHILTWSIGKESKQEAYWSLPMGVYAGTKKQAQQDLNESLTSAIQKRLIADVEVGAFLSGGIDSSLVVSIITKVLGEKSKTFTIGFSEDNFDERSYARLVAEECQTEHFEQCLSNFDTDDLSSLVLSNVGQPFADSSLLPTALVSELASKHVKVALSGDGADELFSGYQRYQARMLMRWYARFPNFMKNSIEKAVRLIPEPMSHHSRSILKKAHLFQDIVNRSNQNQSYVAPSMYSIEDFSQLAPALEGYGHEAPKIQGDEHVDDIMSMMASDAVVYLPQDILAKVDRASMAYSLETRAPFLDSKVLALAYSLPIHWHRKNFKGKCMLRDTFKELLPEKIWSRRKQGFAVPLHEWFRGKLGLDFEALLAEGCGPLNKNFIQRMLYEHRNSSRDHGYRLWGVYVYLVCMNEFKWK
jgi:asparagine synthase (glutamine-hydrolysing)